MPLSPELKDLIDPLSARVTENRSVVPISFARQLLCRLVSEKYPENAQKQEELIARYSPLAEWLTQPRSIGEFQELKSSLLYLAWAKEEWELGMEVGETLYEFRKTLLGKSRRFPNKDYPIWQESVNWLSLLASELRILDLKRVEEAKKDKKNSGIGMTSRLWEKIEGFTSTAFFSKIYSGFYNGLEELSRKLEFERGLDHIPISISRVGLIIGDFS